jgi:hypothetical protein
LSYHPLGVLRYKGYLVPDWMRARAQSLYELFQLGLRLIRPLLL